MGGGVGVGDAVGASVCPTGVGASVGDSVGDGVAGGGVGDGVSSHTKLSQYVLLSPFIPLDNAVSNGIPSRRSSPALVQIIAPDNPFSLAHLPLWNMEHGVS